MQRKEHHVRRRSAITVLLTVVFALTLPLTLPAGGVSREESSVATAWSRDDAAHLLRRAGFGGTPEQIDRLFALGREGAVDYLIAGKVPAGAETPFAHFDLP